MKRVLAALAVAATLVGGLGIAASSPAAAQGQPTPAIQAAKPYLVALRRAPVASYDGGIAGYPATMPRPGERFNDDRADVTAYRTLLSTEQGNLLESIGSPTVLYSYTTALDGFAALLTPTQAKALSISPRVMLVQPDVLLPLDDAGSASGPLPAGEPPPTKMWRQAGGAAAAGRGEVVGVVDTGVGLANPSLAGIPVSTSTLARRYPGFTGVCEHGAGWSASDCSSKVIAARYFVRGFGRAKVATSDFLSPRDGNGHGTSVAAIAAGNSGVDTTIAGQSFGHISGMAPAAGISVYKACWSAPDPRGDGCDLADVVAAVDQAVRDGVDVLSYSIAGTDRGLDDAVEMAFLNAAAANVVVAAAAGNGGPRPGTVQHPSPWVTTVGANTQDVYEGGIRLGDGTTYVGAMLSDRDVGPAPLVFAGDVPAKGVSAARAALCYPGSLDAQHVDGAIVVCDRGVTARVSKSSAVAQSGGVAMVLVNTRRESVDADVHAVPTVHLDVAAGRAVKSYLARVGASATGSIVSDATDDPLAPVVAGFSGRGPAAVAGGDLLKPDLTAPGVSVVAAVPRTVAPGRLWSVESGTSIAAPHAAGVAAVVRAAHPTWTPSMVKSAMMTTATPLQGASTPLGRGAGELHPATVLRPGLVYESGIADWKRLLRDPATAERMNQASISVGDLVGRPRVKRTVTNVGDTRDTYTVSVQGLRGVSAAVAPSVLTLAPGQSRSYTVTFTATKRATYDRFSTGALTWRDAAGRTVTSPVAVRPQLASVPREVTGTGRQGTAVVRALAGVTGTLHATTSGLVGVSPVALSLHPRAFQPKAPATSIGTALETLSVPADTRAVRFQIGSSNRHDDVDLYVYRGSSLVASATDSSNRATIMLTRPRAGSYRVFVNAHRAATAGGTVDATLTSWVLPMGDQGNLDLTPTTFGVDGGRRFTVDASWSGLSPKQRWWGLIGYRGLPRTTSITIN